ncbi:MAG: RAMP superfamily CRISPR-associated protein, partial [Acidobacteriota bacterium]
HQQVKNCCAAYCHDKEWFMIIDYIAKEITDNKEDLTTLVNAKPLVTNAAFNYLKATCLERYDKKKPDQFRGEWKPQVEDYDLMNLINIFETPEIQIHQMPLLSFHISFTFILSKPYISRDDDPFYIIDNPIKKDKIFRLPYVSPGTYKGAARAAARNVIGSPPTPDAKFDNKQIERLFGIDRRREENDLYAGRLRFSPTFFRQISLEIINPHNRKSGAGTLPIQFEVVPAKCEGHFNLLYFPFNSTPFNYLYGEVAEDVLGVARILQAMFTTYGFGAKTSSGYGTASKIKNGRFRMCIDEIQEIKPVNNEPLPNYLAERDRLKPEYLTPDGRFRERSKDELNKLNKKTCQEYEKARKWWERRQKDKPEIIPLPPPKPVFEREFKSFQELMDKAGELASRLKVKEEAGNEVA